MNTHFDIYGLMTTTVKSLPYVSEGIPAGFPSPAADYIGDRIDLNEVLILSPGATYYARVRDYYLVEEELEQGDGILFDTRLTPRTGDLAFCEVCGERMLKYIRKRGARAMASRWRNGRHAFGRRRYRSAGSIHSSLRKRPSRPC